MRMRFRSVSAEKIYPVMGLFGSVVVSKKGALTIGWEVTYPTAYTMEEDEYDDIVRNFASGIRLMKDSGCVMHRQDIYLYEEYDAGVSDDDLYLERCYKEFHSGRRHLVHHSYLFVTLAHRRLIDKGGKNSGLFGINGSVSVPSQRLFDKFRKECRQLIAVLETGGLVSFRELTRVDWLGEGSKVGIIQRYMMLGNDSRTMSDIEMRPDSVGVHGMEAQSFLIGETDHLPGEYDTVAPVAALSSAANSVLLSYGSALGIQLDCEHAVNQVIYIPDQPGIKHELETQKNQMTSGIASTDNRINAGEIAEYLDDVYRDGLITVKASLSLTAWGPREDRQEITGKISTALSSMGIDATYESYETPVIWYAGIPSNAYEIGKENFMKMESTSTLGLAPMETFDMGIPGGLFRICDRTRLVPIPMDTSELAQSLGYIGNYNHFILGGSGSGKSFFTNYYLRCLYRTGASVFVIDVGDSYEGLAAVISEQTGGRDGTYLSWDKDHPFSFNPFLDVSLWLRDSGGLNTDQNGVNFFMSFLQTAWRPKGDGWTSSLKSVLTQIIVDFLRDRNGSYDGLVFDDFFRFLDITIAPRIRYEAPRTNPDGTERTPKEIDDDCRMNGYLVGNILVNTEKLDIDDFVLALRNYSGTGSYGFLLNDPHPKDLFTSRFTVFEVAKLSSDDRDFYSICILCMMHAFEEKMHKSPEFKTIVIEEAWKAIANETMAPFIKDLYKTARKYNAGAVVVTQEIDDIIDNPVVKTTIIDNSDIKMLLDQSNHLNRFDKIEALMSLNSRDRNLVLSLNRDMNPDTPFYKEVFIKLGDKKSFVAANLVSPQEAVAYESKKTKKEPFLKLAKELGSAIAAIDRLTGRTGNKNR